MTNFSVGNNKKNNFLVAGGLERGYNTVFTGGETVNKVSKILKYYENFSLVVDDSVLEEKVNYNFNLVS